jgi:hypothetical protein
MTVQYRSPDGIVTVIARMSSPFSPPTAITTVSNKNNTAGDALQNLPRVAPAQRYATAKPPPRKRLTPYGRLDWGPAPAGAGPAVAVRRVDRLVPTVVVAHRAVLVVRVRLLSGAWLESLATRPCKRADSSAALHQHSAEQASTTGITQFASYENHPRSRHVP